MFRTAADVRSSLAAELIRIFDAGAEVRFYPGAQPASAVPTAGWVASRPILATSENGTPAGQAITFTTTESPYAATYAKKITGRAAPDGTLAILADATAKVTATQAARDAAASAVVTAETAWDAAVADAATKASAVTTATSALTTATTALTNAQGALEASGVTLSVAQALSNRNIAYNRMVSMPIGYSSIPTYKFQLLGITLSFWDSSTYITSRYDQVYNLIVAADNSNQSSLADTEVSLAAAEANVAAKELEYQDAYNTYGPTHATTTSKYDAWVSARDARDTLITTKNALTNKVAVAAEITASFLGGGYGSARTAYATASELHAAAVELYALPDIAPLVTARDNAQADVATKTSAKATAQQNYDAAAELVSANGSLVANREEKQNALASAQEHLKLAEQAKAAAEDQADEEQQVIDTMLADWGRELMPIPASGWCRVIHPAYPEIFFDGTFGQEGDEKDFTVNPDGAHTSLVVLHPLTFTIPAV